MRPVDNKTKLRQQIWREKLAKLKKFDNYYWKLLESKS